MVIAWSRSKKFWAKTLCARFAQDGERNHQSINRRMIMFQVQPLSQKDPRWKNSLIGTDQNSTIGSFGCLLTDLTMVVNAFGARETPTTLNDKMRNAGGYQGSLIIPAVLPVVTPQVQFNRFQPCENSPAPIADIDTALAAGNPVIVEVDYSPAAGLQSHWVILLSMSGNDYVIQDPWPF